MSRSRENLKKIKDLWKQFLPLSLSDVTMAFGDPAITATLAQLPNARTNLAGVGVAKSLAVFFESPVIMLLHASNALAGSLKARTALWRFTKLLMLVLSASLLLLCFPQVFQFVGLNFIGIGPELITPARTVLLFLILWPAFIAWRRYYQGLLIHSGHGNHIARAGMGRLLFVALTLVVGYFLSIPGAILAGFALIGGVLAESVLVTRSARVTLSTETPKDSTTIIAPDSLSQIWRFYWPLANSMLVVWGGRALLIAVVARSFDATLALAAWPAAWGLVLLVANSTRMVQQVIIRNRGIVEDRTLIQFALSVGVIVSLLLHLIAITALGKGAVMAFVGFDEALFSSVHPAILLCSLVPFFVALQNAVQGFLIKDGKTQRVNLATWLGTFTLLSSATVLVTLDYSGAVTAAISMNLGLIVETTVLATGSINLKQFLSQLPGHYDGGRPNQYVHSPS